MLLTNVELLKQFLQENDIQFFWPYEFICPHCNAVKIDSRVVLIVNELRQSLNKPVIITSAYRCPDYNKQIGGAKNSAHMKGLALDIAIPNSNYRFKVLEFLFKKGIRRIGIGKTFIHFDIDDTLPHPVVWHYYK